MTADINLYVATQQKIEIPLPSIYSPIIAGAEQYTGEVYQNYLLDNTGDNISNLNKSYCELTVLYWIWKNSSNKYVGLCHYRRYFFSGVFRRLLLEPISERDLRQLEHGDVVVPNKRYFRKSCFDDFGEFHDIKDLMSIRSILSYYDAKYLPYCDIVFNRKWMYCYNMMIADKDIFNSYCSWLFPILHLFDNNYKHPYNDKYNQRVDGFLSERLFNIWILANDCHIIEKPVYNIQENILLPTAKNTIKKIFY